MINHHDNTSFFATSSLTYAYKAKDALSYAGIGSSVIRLSGNETKKGCRYGIRVDMQDRLRARRVLADRGIVFTEP